LTREGRGVPDRADLRDVALEGQQHGPVERGAHLANQARDLTQVVGAGKPPGEEAREPERPDLAHGLVATEVDEAGAARIAERPGLAVAELGGDVARGNPRLANRVLGGRR